MNKKLITYQVEQYINNEISSIKIEYELESDAKEVFYLNTVKRLVRAYSLYKMDDVYKNDYIMALRDYLLVYDVVVKIEEDEFLRENEFGISLDEVEMKYFASYQLPTNINEKFVKEAFIKGVEIQRNTEEANLISDPMISELTGYRYTRFKSLEQKLAVYGALNTPDGYTTLISLPTGGGKSLVTQAISYQKDGLTIVIVPTVSLAIDQERVTKDVIKRKNNDEEIYSYSSGVNAGPILKAIKEKKAKVLFISPEALLENPAFSEVVKEANKNRYLKNIVIDEAHIVVDWGAAFRVDYQCLESWRNMLLMSNPSLRTILLSATFEDKCVETLKNFFEINGRWIEIRCDALRHEPRYCVVRTKNFKEKEKNIIEMVRKLPHPMIVYVARPADADYIKKFLAYAGINNVKTFTGLTGAAQRRKLIDEWVNDEFEIMIATSAFGVGVDKGDVRTVIHIYIPQNANTYYQELGRGGRDRLPCLSVMCLQPEDTTIGRDRISKKVLTSEKIIGRWDSLFNNSKSIRLSNNRVFIDTSIKPNYADADEFDDSPTSDADRNWNIYVILFLRRYNMIHILEIKVDSGHYMILIKIEDDRLRIVDDELKRYIEVIRETEWNFYNTSYNTIANAVRNNCKECISELFTDTYSKVYEFCAGCNAHNDSIVGDIPKFPLKNRVSEPLRSLSDEQIAIFGDAQELVVIANRTNQEELIKKLVEKGISLIIVPDKYKYSESFLKMNTNKNIMIFGLEEIFQLISKRGFFFTSGLVAAIYPAEEKEIGQQYVVVKNNLCGKPSTKVIHIIEKNAYVAEAGKTFVELVDGPSIQPNVVYA